MKRDWKNIHLDFNYQGQNWETNYQKKWEDLGFTYHQTKEWIDSGMKPADARFCWWLREFKQKDAEWVLNYGNMAELRKEYENTNILDG
ncbi:MAG: hypothetical protein LBR43_00150 [Spiroplasmataceae bacterium]|jgi:hypothetical protein|nr:hypothetical protein [Spiroplasmataceae bacterium]